MSEIFIFGDSISWGACDPSGGGWAQLIKSEIYKLQLSTPDLWCPVFNLGIPGDTAAGVARRLEGEICARHETGQDIFALLAIGINDSIFNLSDAKASLSARQFRLSLDEIIQKAKRLRVELCVVGLAPVDEALLNPLPWNANLAYTFERARIFESELESFCAQNDLQFINIWSSWIEQDWKTLLSDGLHPNSEGHRIIYQLVRGAVLQWLA